MVMNCVRMIQTAEAVKFGMLAGRAYQHGTARHERTNRMNDGSGWIRSEEAHIRTSKNMVTFLTY